VSATVAVLRTAVIAGFAVMFAGSATAESQDDSQAARLIAARIVFDACGERAQLDAFFEKSAEMVVKDARVRTPTYSDAQWKAYQTIVTADLKKGLDEYVAYTTAIYANYFTVDDLKLMEAYCRSPTGQKVSSLRGQIEADTFDFRQHWLRSALIAAMGDAQKQVESGGGAL
jgi:hypothetical protein